jgi:type IV pilus assembly protein PilW
MSAQMPNRRKTVSMSVGDRPALIGCAPKRRRARSFGFSLVELMVALVIASLLLVGLTLLYANTNTARIELDKTSRQIESGRYATQILSDDVRHAGYYGPLILAPTLGVASLPDPCSTTLTVVQNSMALYVQGYDGQATAALLDPGKLGCLTGAAVGYKANTGVLVVRRADTSIAAAAPTSGWFNIQVSGCAGDTSPYILNLDTSPSAFTLHMNGSPGCTPITSAPAAKITPYYVRIYFISNCSGTDCSAAGADSVPTLKRVDVTSTGTVITPIVDNIENLQFEYGIDTTVAPGDGAPDVYKSATTATFADWQNVMAIRIYLLARNSDPTGGGFTDVKTYAMGPAGNVTTGDSYARHAYNELVRLNNPSGRRE